MSALPTWRLLPEAPTVPELDPHSRQRRLAWSAAFIIALIWLLVSHSLLAIVVVGLLGWWLGDCSWLRYCELKKRTAALVRRQAWAELPENSAWLAWFERSHQVELRAAYPMFAVIAEHSPDRQQLRVQLLEYTPESMGRIAVSLVREQLFHHTQLAEATALGTEWQAAAAEREASARQHHQFDAFTAEQAERERVDHQRELDSTVAAVRSALRSGRRQ
jgi:hypothetical protein